MYEWDIGRAPYETLKIALNQLEAEGRTVVCILPTHNSATSSWVDSAIIVTKKLIITVEEPKVDTVEVKE